MHPCSNCGNEWPSQWAAAECCSPTVEIPTARTLHPADVTDDEAAALQAATRLMLDALDANQ